MANIKSAKKRDRQIKRRDAVNGMCVSRLRTYLRKVEEAIDGGDKAVAEAAFRAAQPELMRSAQKGLIHRNLVARKLSRLTARVKAMAA
ncbi:MAG: 30S ribosomal protein S20 [Rhodospirillales bacterium RIFCSPLOWO2_12_FULL_58_28]|nr:MAG: 30S ribosomal protein S20 [Rhodospirillales bacterium RIFCSPLOWO2_02_FULL_58_16]OHC77910.1 MAG: 30S ribosomal protein S20 [Rhodospirillales bacterium RIFCSPLOWO2_12_FULL_58_28]